MNSNDSFEPGESFSYVCESDKISEDYTNTASVTADPVDDNLDPVSDNDDSKVIVEEPKECTKLDVNPNPVFVGKDTNVICE
jgi:hypothetical protein